MFKFFKTKSQDKKEDTEIASIKFYLDADDTPKISENLESYEEKELYALARLINLLSKDTLQIETLGIIQNFFQKMGRSDIFKTIIDSVLIDDPSAFKETSPYIKPSEMMK